MWFKVMVQDGSTVTICGSSISCRTYETSGETMDESEPGTGDSQEMKKG